MNLQYLHDIAGKPTGVFIPIQEWEKLKNKYEDLQKEESQIFEVPEWHKKIVLARLKDYEKNPGKVLDWDKVQDNFNFD